MTKEEKQLLLKDLCARLTNGVKLGLQDVPDLVLEPRSFDIFTGQLIATQIYPETSWSIKYGYEFVAYRPYLRPMSSMTEDEKIERLHLITEVKKYSWIDKLLDFYLSHHLDYRGLILLGLALEAPEGMYKNE